MSILTLKDVSYCYKGTKKTVLDSISCSFEMGELSFITGPSGAGKTTLLSLIAGLDLPSSGIIEYDGQNMEKQNRDEYRSRMVGVIFQSYNLLPGATAVQNVMLSMHISGQRGKKLKESAYASLERVGIDREKADRLVLKLSGGEQQRVSIARAIANGAPILIADEPTGNLDKDNEQAVTEIFERLAHEDGKCVIVVTHSERATDYADSLFQLNKGRIEKEQQEGQK